MIGRALLVVLLTTAAPCLAAESPVPTALKQFGLLGTWAINCAEPASSTNEYSIYAVSPSGEATLAYGRGEPYRNIVYRILTAQPMGESRLALHVLGLPGGIAVDLVLRKEDDAIRVWSSHTPDGRMLVIDGVITGNGRQSPRFERCGK